MWSLSVEEQFYLLWPLFLVLIVRTKRPLLFVLSFLALSLSVSEYLLLKDPIGSFFLTPSRFYEFAIGGSILWLNKPKSNLLKELLCLTGLGLIAAAIFSYSQNTQFPGINALLPCIGTALLIHSGDARVSGKILRERIFTNIGRISYSLYLVHWPVIIFYKYYNLSILTDLDRITISLISFSLAILLYISIEKIYRLETKKINNISTKSFFLQLTTFATLLLAISVHASQNDGWPWRIKKKDNSVNTKELSTERNALYFAICHSKGWGKCHIPSADEKEKILVIGDSHAVDGLNIFYSAYPNYDYSIITKGGCPPLTKEDASSLFTDDYKYKQCEETFQNIASTIKNYTFKAIVLSPMYYWYKPKHLHNAIREIRKETDTRIIVLGNYLHLKSSFPDLFARKMKLEDNPDQVFDFTETEKSLINIKEENLTYISLTSILCQSPEISSCRIWFDGKPFTYDSNHLTYEAAAYIGLTISEEIPDLLK